MGLPSRLSTVRLPGPESASSRCQADARRYHCRFLGPGSRIAPTHWQSASTTLRRRGQPGTRKHSLLVCEMRSLSSAMHGFPPCGSGEGAPLQGRKCHNRPGCLEGRPAAGGFLTSVCRVNLHTTHRRPSRRGRVAQKSSIKRLCVWKPGAICTLPGRKARCMCWTTLLLLDCRRSKTHGNLAAVSCRMSLSSRSSERKAHVLHIQTPSIVAMLRLPPESKKAC